MDALPDFKYLRPSSIAEVAQMFGSRAGSRFIAGGTDLIANIRRGLAAAEIEGHHRTELLTKLLTGQFVVRMGWQTGICNFLYLVMIF